MTPTARLACRILKRSALVFALFFFVACAVFADDVTISDGTFDCIVNWPKIRNTRIKNQDPQSLEKAMRIFQDSVANAEYPAGTILQLVPYEAMVKRSAETFPKTHGWEFFSLDVSGSGTKIRDRGDNVVNVAQGVTCFSCHSAAWAYRRSRPPISTDRDHLFRTIATSSAARVLTAPLDDGGCQSPKNWSSTARGRPGSQ